MKNRADNIQELKIDHVDVPTRAGYSVSVKAFKPGDEAKAVVVIASATGVKQRYYFKYADFLRNNGYVVFTFDYGGIGESGNSSLSGFPTSATHWAKNDLEEVIRYAVKTYPGIGLTLTGHSIGGQLIGLAPSAMQADRILLVAAQTGYWKYWRGLERWRMFFNWYFLFPVITKIFGYFPGKRLGVMENLPGGMVWEWRRWCVTPDYLFGHYKEEELYYGRLRARVFAYSIEDDRYAPVAAVDWLSARYGKNKTVRRHFSPVDFGLESIGHFGLFRSRNRDSFWNLLLKDTGG